jgi:hypothetical protein
MFCPQCGQERVLLDTNYCSRCGFLLTGTADLLRMGGQLPQLSSSDSKQPTARSRGLKQGLFIFLLSFLVVPIIAIITVAVRAEPFAVVISAILLFVGGLLRMAYAMMFESADPLTPVDAQVGPRSFAAPTSAGGLPPQRQTPASSYARPEAGNWRDTNDLQPAQSEKATKLLNEDEQ